MASRVNGCTASHSILLLATCAVALSWRQAGAQVRPVARPAASAKSNDPGGRRAAPAAGGTLHEIIVTAERFSENVQTAALAISVLDTHQLATAGVVNVQELTKLVPGLQVGLGGPYTQIYIRGIGDFGSNSLADPGVAPYLDGVFVSREAAVGGMFYDLARVEVLKGPQGTLYGMDTTGGAINLITHRPTFRRVEGYVDLETGNYGEINGEGALNVPLGAHLATRLAFQTVNNRGYLSDGSNDAAQQSARIETLWKPADEFSLLLQADYTHQGGHGEGAVLTIDGPGPSFSPWTSVASPLANDIQLARSEPTQCVPTAILNGLDSASPPRGALPPPSCSFGLPPGTPGTNLYSGNAETWQACHVFPNRQRSVMESRQWTAADSPEIRNIRASHYRRPPVRASRARPSAVDRLSSAAACPAG